MYKILIVEGDVNFSSTLKIYLEQDNSEVVIVNNFEKVMGYLYPFHPHLVILGAELPIFDGFYWLRRIRNTGD